MDRSVTKTWTGRRASRGVLALLLLALFSGADIYRSQDARGRTVFSDRAVPGAERIELEPVSPRYQVSLARVVDGDTLRLESGESVRLLGINTPEVASRYRDAEAGGEQARQWLRRKLEGEAIYLEHDAERVDRYDRLLAHVFLEDGEHINASLLESGLAMLTITPPNLAYSDSLQQAQLRAESARRGVWAMPEYQVASVSDLEPGARYRGWQRWQGRVTAVTSSRRYVNLTMSEHFVVRIPKAHQALFPPLEAYLYREIEVRGWMSRQGQSHWIRVMHPSAIVVR